MDYKFVHLACEDGVARLTLNQPDKLNALSTAMMEELDHAARRAAAMKDARCLLLTGAGRAFCSGADLTDPNFPRDAEGRPDTQYLLRRYYDPVVKTLTALPMPVVTAVNGAAAGAGMSLALLGDIVLAGRSAYFLQAFANIGLVPDAGATFILPRLIGNARATAAMMLAERIPAATAEAWGMIYKTVDDDALAAEAGATAKRLAAGPTMALNGIRQLVQASASNALSAQLDLESSLQGKMAKSADFWEGVQAFTEKRPATFKGR